MTQNNRKLINLINILSLSLIVFLVSLQVDFFEGLPIIIYFVLGMTLADELYTLEMYEEEIFYIKLIAIFLWPIFYLRLIRKLMIRVR